MTDKVLIKLQQSVIHVGGVSLRSGIHKLINSNRNSEESPYESKFFDH